MAKNSKKTPAAKKSPKATKVTTGKKAQPQVTNKIVIRDACAQDGCTREPIKGSSYCAEHDALHQALKAMKGVEVVANAAPAAAPAPTSALPEEASVFKTVPAVINELRRRGWTDFQIGAAVGVGANSRRSTVWAWRTGKATTDKLAALQALLAFPAPGGKTIAKTVRSAVKAAYAVRAPAPKVVDPRQLFLDLRDALNRVIDATA